MTKAFGRSKVRERRLQEWLPYPRPSVLAARTASQTLHENDVASEWLDPVQVKQRRSRNDAYAGPYKGGSFLPS